MEPPTKDEIAAKLKSLVRGDLSREDVSEWARPWITRLEEVSDADVRRAIDSLCAADMPSTDRPYLYGPDDFEQWLSEFDR